MIACVQEFRSVSGQVVGVGPGEQPDVAVVCDILGQGPVSQQRRGVCQCAGKRGQNPGFSRTV